MHLWRLLSVCWVCETQTDILQLKSFGLFWTKHSSSWLNLLTWCTDFICSVDEPFSVKLAQEHVDVCVAVYTEEQSCWNMIHGSLQLVPRVTTPTKRSWLTAPCLHELMPKCTVNIHVPLVGYVLDAMDSLLKGLFLLAWCYPWELIPQIHKTTL